MKGKGIIGEIVSQKVRGERKNIFNPFKKVYLKIREDEEKKNKSVLLGWLSILFSLVSVGLAYFGVVFGIKGVVFAFTHNFGFFTYLLGLGNLLLGFASLGLFLIPYYMWVDGIVLVFMQLRLNKKFIGWLALIIWFASLVGIILVSYITFDSILSGALNS